MVAAGPVDMTILKAKFGSDIRKSALRHNNDLTFNDLYFMVQRIFGISKQDTILLKYKDSDGDLVTLVDDSDVLLALQSEPTLFIEVLVDSPALNAVASVQEHIASLQAATERLVQALTELEVSNVAHKSTSQINGGCSSDSVSATVPSAPSPVPCKQEIEHVASPTPATIQPSSHEQVSSDGAHHFRHAPESEVSLEEYIPLGADASIIQPPSPQLPPFQAQPQLDCQVPPPPQMFGAPPQQLGAPSQPEHQAPPTSIPSFPQSQAPPPVQTSGVPSVPEQLQPQQFSNPPHGLVHQFGATQGPPQFGGQAPPPNFNNESSQQQQQQFAPPPQFGAPQPTPPSGSVSIAGSQGPPQLGAPVQGPPNQLGGQIPPSPQFQHGPPSQFGIQPSVPPQFAPPPQFGGPAPSQGPPGPGHFLGQGPPHPGPFPGAPQPGNEQQNQQPQFAPPTSFAPSGPAPPPQFGGQAPPAFPPGAGFPPVGAPPMGGIGGPGGNPFARGPGGPPVQYRQSPYQQ